jgi:hypothetical protein
VKAQVTGYRAGVARRRHFDELIHDAQREDATQRAFMHLASSYEDAAQEHARRAELLELRGDLSGAEQERRRCRVKLRLARAAVDGRFED